MLVNAGKTELIVCGDRRQLTRIEQTPSIMFMGQQLGCKSAVKNLGVMMDSQLGWESHVKLIWVIPRQIAQQLDSPLSIFSKFGGRIAPMKLCTYTHFKLSVTFGVNFRGHQRSNIFWNIAS